MRHRPDPLFVFERLAALERSLGAQRAERAAAPPLRGSPARELDAAGQAPLQLRRVLESIASLDPQEPGAARAAVALARNALRDVSPSDR